MSFFTVEIPGNDVWKRTVGHLQQQYIRGNRWFLTSELISEINNTDAVECLAWLESMGVVGKEKYGLFDNGKKNGVSMTMARDLRQLDVSIMEFDAR